MNKYTKCIAQVGDRVELIEMTGEDLPRGLQGTITHIAEVYNNEQDISVKWDNASGLNLIYPLDDFKVLGK
jgi:hypothetical protein